MKLFNRNIFNLFMGQFISMMGDSALWTVLVYLTLALNPPNASFKAGLVTFMETIPFLLFGIIAGMIGDRFDRRKIMILGDIARTCILVVVPLAYIFDFLTWQLLGCVAFGVGMFSALFNPARDALLPDIADDRDLLKINSLFQTSTQFAIIGGTGLAAALLGATSGLNSTQEIPRLVTVFGFDALTFLLSAVFVWMIRVPVSRRGGAELNSPWTRQFREILIWVKKDSLLAGLLFITAIDNLFIMGPAIVGTNLFVRETLGMGPEALAFAEFVLAMGMAVSSFAILKWGQRIPKGKLVIFGILLDGLTFIPFFWVRSYFGLIVVMFIHSLSIPAIIIPRTTLIQENVVRHRLAKAFGLINITIFGFWSISAIMTGWIASILAGYVGSVSAPPYLFLIAGAGGSACGILGLAFRGLRRS